MRSGRAVAPGGGVRAELQDVIAYTEIARSLLGLPVEAGSDRRSDLECAWTVLRASGTPTVLAGARAAAYANPTRS